MSEEEQKVSWWLKFKQALKLPEEPKLRKKRIILASTVGVIIIGAAVGLAMQIGNVSPNSLNGLDFDGIEDKLTGKLAKSDLDGLEYDSGLANRRPVAVMVENHPQARPQFGLTQASVVYEAIAEGGITRYLAVFGPKDAERVGPIRSARTYYLDWALEYNAIYAHVGGAANALEKIRGDKDINDIDAAGQPVMWRERRGSEASEHTMYGNTNFMRGYAKDVGWEVDKSTYEPWKFSEDKRTAEQRDTDTQITAVTIPFSGSYRVSYTYDAEKNNWQRVLANEADIDELNKEQITPTNIVVIYLNRSETVSAGKQVGVLDLYSGGDATVFTGGKQTDGTWKKKGEGERMRFYDENDKEITLTPGQTFVEVLQPGMALVTTEKSASTEETTQN